MPDRSWFLAANGQQQGPYPEAQLLDFIARGMVTPQTFVWTEGMADWQKAGEIPGLMSASAGSRAVPQSDGPFVSTGGSGSSLSIDFGILDFTWRSILLILGLVLVIPAPWVIVWYQKWLTSCVRVPGRPNLDFTGRAITIVPWYFGAIVVAIIFSVIGEESDHRAIGQVGTLIQIALYWLFLKWLIVNLASNGHPLGLSFSGSFWAFLGWSILAAISIVTIIGWAWVYPAQIRWVCRNIRGTRRQVVFNGTGLEYLWRMIVTALASVFIIPIPWVCRWMIRWQFSQTELVERGAYAKI
jgi:hypothetical protein